MSRLPLLALSTMSWSLAAHGLPLDPDDIRPTVRLIESFVPASSSFNSNEDLYTSNTIFGASANGGLYPSDSFTPLVAFDDGAMSLAVRVLPPPAGLAETVGGVFQFVNLSASNSLGLAVGAPVLTATITDSHFSTDGGAPLAQFRGRIDTISPAVSAIVGPLKSLLIYDFVSPSIDFINTPWGASFVSSGYTSGPDVWMTPWVLPLSWAAARAESIHFSTGVTTTSYDAVTDQYVMQAIMGSAGDPSWLRSYPDTGTVIANDIVATVNLTATVDEDGVVSAGSVLLTGSSASLGIPGGSTLLAGDVVEAIFLTAPFEFNFQFLIDVTTVHPAYEAAVGGVETVVVYDYISPDFDFFNDPWNSNVSSTSFTTSPDLAFSSERFGVSDSDGDGLPDSADNCVAESNGDQRDTDADGIGSRCDADFNQDCEVNIVDLGEFRANFLTASANHDFNGDGVVNAIDLGVLKAFFFTDLTVDNPSSVPNICDSGRAAR